MTDTGITTIEIISSTEETEAYEIRGLEINSAFVIRKLLGNPPASYSDETIQIIIDQLESKITVMKNGQAPDRTIKQYSTVLPRYLDFFKIYQLESILIARLTQLLKPPYDLLSKQIEEDFRRFNAIKIIERDEVFTLSSTRYDILSVKTHLLNLIRNTPDHPKVTEFLEVVKARDLITNARPDNLYEIPDPEKTLNRDNDNGLTLTNRTHETESIETLIQKLKIHTLYAQSASYTLSRQYNSFIRSLDDLMVDNGQGLLYSNICDSAVIKQKLSSRTSILSYFTIPSGDPYLTTIQNSLNRLPLVDSAYRLKTQHILARQIIRFITHHDLNFELVKLLYPTLSNTILDYPDTKATNPRPNRE